MIVIDDIEQGTDEWMALRCGIPSASNFDKIITTKGDTSAQATKYMHTLVAEYITGQKASVKQSEAMLRGIEMEAEARQAFEFITDLEVEQVAFCYKDKKRLVGCSPDGIIGKQTLEIKCPLPGTHVGYLLGNKIPTEYIVQVQGQLWVTGFPSGRFMSYCPGMDPLIIEFFRDDMLHTAMDEIIPAFIKKMLDARKQLENK